MKRIHQITLCSAATLEFFVSSNSSNLFLLLSVFMIFCTVKYIYHMILKKNALILAQKAPFPFDLDLLRT